MGELNQKNETTTAADVVDESFLCPLVGVYPCERFRRGCFCHELHLLNAEWASRRSIEAAREGLPMTDEARGRIAIVSDEEGKWYVRSIRVVEHDLERDEKVYRCDRHLGGPFALAEVPQIAAAIRGQKP
jgi:hypothetical protein